jgi:uncharacterized protein (DUF2267 family)
MTYDEFVGQVQHRAKLGSTGEAVAAIRATFQTLAERLAGNTAWKLAAQLPQEIGEYLRSPTSGAGDSFPLSEFFQRVTAREKVDEPDAVYHARVVMEVLAEAVTGGEIQKVLAQLPEDYFPLFESGSIGALR